MWIKNEEGRLMSHRKQKYTIALFTILGISLSCILIVSSGGASVFLIVIGQQEDQQNTINSTNIGNESSILLDPTQNQTMTNQTGTAALSANLTQSDFDSLKQDLTEARQALENNDTTALLDELNSASGELFQVSSRQFDPDHVEAMTEEFNPLQTHIDRAQETALKDNHTGTLQELSAAESELSAIVQTLPLG
jgi:hypothetical protein